MDKIKVIQGLNGTLVVSEIAYYTLVSAVNKAEVYEFILKSGQRVRLESDDTTTLLSQLTYFFDD